MLQTVWKVESAETPPAAKTNFPTFEVKGYLVTGNTILPQKQVDEIMGKHTGPALTLEALQKATADLELTYHRLGFVTVGVALPRQRLTNGIVRVQVTEGKLVAILVKGNHYYSSNNVLRALPGLATNVLLSSKWLQPELDRANINKDRQIYPKLIPGPDPGTTALELTVKDRLPFHGHVEINNKGTPGTPELRMDSGLEYNNLWQLNHQLGLDYNFSPTDVKPAGNTQRFYDQPLVSSYSAFYRMPFGTGGNLRESYERKPLGYGYDEVTHRFNLPPASGSPELVVYASRSTTDAGSRLGAVTPITDSQTLTVTDQTAERNPSVTQNIGTRFILPLGQWRGVQSSVNFGFDFKTFYIESLATNTTTVAEYTTNVPPTLIFSQAVALSKNSGNEIDYVPLSLGWSGSRQDALGQTTLGLNGSLFLSELSSTDGKIQAVAGSTGAGGNFGVVNFNFSREEKLPGNWSLLLRANGQWASEPLINNEQFGIGGTGGVRGYREGEAYGDTGWRTLFDARTPLIGVAGFPYKGETIPASLRFSWFMDYGEVSHLGQNAAPTSREWGTGMGVFYTLGQHVDARAAVGWALIDAPPQIKAGTAQGHLSFGVQF